MQMIFHIPFLDFTYLATHWIESKIKSKVSAAKTEYILWILMMSRVKKNGRTWAQFLIALSIWSL